MPDSTPDINVTTVFLLLGELKENVKSGFEGVNTRLDTQNGRVGKGESRVAELTTRVAVLEERNPGNASAGWWGAGMGTAAVAILEVGKAVASAWMK